MMPFWQFSKRSWSDEKRPVIVQWWNVDNCGNLFFFVIAVPMQCENDEIPILIMFFLGTYSVFVSSNNLPSLETSYWIAI